MLAQQNSSNLAPTGVTGAGLLNIPDHQTVTTLTGDLIKICFDVCMSVHR